MSAKLMGESNLTPDEIREYEKLKNLLDKCKEWEFFEHEGRIYRGHYITACKEFIKNNPTGGDFSVWLQDHYNEYDIIHHV